MRRPFRLELTLLGDRLAPGAGPLVSAGGLLFSLTGDGAGGYELWATDGTVDGNRRVAAGIKPMDANVSYLHPPTPVILIPEGGAVYYLAADGADAAGLWRADGTGAVLLRGGLRVTVRSYKGTVQSFEVTLPRDLTAAEGRVYFVAAGDVTGDGVADLAFGGGPGGAPRVRLFDGAKLVAAAPFATLDAVPVAALADFFAGDNTNRGGVHPLLRDVDGDGKADLTTGSGDAERAQVRVYTSSALFAGITTPDQEMDPFDGISTPFGVFVG